MANSGNSVSSPPEKPTKTPVCREIDFSPFPPTNLRKSQPNVENNSTTHHQNTTGQPTHGTSIINIVSDSDNTLGAAPASQQPRTVSFEVVPSLTSTQVEKKRKCKVHYKPKKKSTAKGNCSGAKFRNGQEYMFIGQHKEDINITLMSSNRGDTGLSFVMRKSTSLRYPSKHYAECIDMCPHDIKLLKDGKELNKHSTVEDNGLEDGDKIFVAGVDPFINVDTRYNLLTIQDLMPQNQLNLQQMAPLTMTMEELHQLWAKYAEKDPETFVLVYNGGDIRRSHKTVAEGDFMNEDIIYCRSKDPAQSSGTLGSSDF